MGASISSGCSLPSRSVRSIRLVMAASRTLQGQGGSEEITSRQEGTSPGSGDRQPHAGGAAPTPSAQGELWRWIKIHFVGAEKHRQLLQSEFSSVETRAHAREPPDPGHSAALRVKGSGSTAGGAEATLEVGHRQRLQCHL